MSNPSKFWNKIADRYAKKPVSDPIAYEKKLSMTQEYLHDDMDVLELGCGTGTTALIHAPYVKSIRAIDISSKMIEIAHVKAEESNTKKVSFEISTIEDVIAPENTYDAVLAMSILHLLEDKKEALTKIFKMLKPGGVFVSSTVCLGDTMIFFKYIGPIGKWLGLIPTIKVFTTRELQECIAVAGFELTYTWRPGPGKSLFIIATKI